MVRTRADNSAPLRDEVDRLIERKLRLMRRRTETRLGGSRPIWISQRMPISSMSLTLVRSKAAIHISTLGTYREAVAALVQRTAEWPCAVGEAIAPILDRAFIEPNQRGAISGILYSHAWRADELPWTARWADGQHFAETVHRVMD